MSDSEVAPFRIQIPQSELVSLRTKIVDTRWPDAETVSDMSQGVSLTMMRALCEYWRREYDWRRCESRLNELGLFETRIDEIDIRFIHVRSREPNAIALLLTHGWPGSIIEFVEAIPRLVDPEAHGGVARDAFHVVVPCLPGFGFSGKPREAGWGFARIADAWIVLMQRLGYEHWVAQGGDLGSGVTEAIGRKRPDGCLGLHLNMSFVRPTPAEIAVATPQELEFLAKAGRYIDDMAGYAVVQGTRPQTIGYLLADSAAGQAAWIYEKFIESTDGRDPADGLTPDEILDNVMMYWLPNAGTSAARLYWELRHEQPPATDPIELPTAYSGFPCEVIRASKRWLEARFNNLVYFNEVDRGGHFAALEQPQLFAEEVRAGCRALRGHR